MFQVLRKRGSAWSGGGSAVIDVDGDAANAGWGYTDNLFSGWGRIRLGKGYYSAFIRFPECPVPQGKTLTKADLKLYVHTGSSGQTGTVSLKIYLNDVDDASVPADWSGFVALDRTTAYLDTSYSAPLSQYDLQTFDIKTPLQEVIDRVGYVANNDIQVIIETYNFTAAESATDFFITDATYYAVLELEWE